MEISFSTVNAMRAQSELDREIAEYYQSLTPEEIEEDRLWVRFASEQAMQRWDEDERRLLPKLCTKSNC